MADSKQNLIRLASIVEESIVDGPGLRFVLFTQGCPHRCLGCHNPKTHLPIGGTLVSVKQITALYSRQRACRGVTFSGGEPFIQAASLARLARAVHGLGGDVIVYTGYRLEYLQAESKKDSGILALLEHTDLLIDGPFVLAKRSLDLPFVGSSNQRLIALTPNGNSLLADIPSLPNSPTIKRFKYVKNPKETSGPFSPCKNTGE